MAHHRERFELLKLKTRYISRRGEFGIGSQPVFHVDNWCWLLYSTTQRGFPTTENDHLAWIRDQ